MAAARRWSLSMPLTNAQRPSAPPKRSSTHLGVLDAAAEATVEAAEEATAGATDLARLSVATGTAEPTVVTEPRAVEVLGALEDAAVVAPAGEVDVTVVGRVGNLFSAFGGGLALVIVFPPRLVACAIDEGGGRGRNERSGQARISKLEKPHRQTDVEVKKIPVGYRYSRVWRLCP
jgi:hypothetical protein